ncbi:hypothetical protein SAMN05660748_0379 [Blastococcus aggregatus]|uniref:DUF1059 domain-containing protein n=1 Tax=Blastococcus aggregatus TaxID=38502 RepID=A0A285V2G0_9ACTN|nr:hypothetical protein [Blastococcus aggregatus]SOC46681.1 hypothetical protein SAMN05660748_0379 [Blastococcus aggregatus]
MSSQWRHVSEIAARPHEEEDGVEKYLNCPCGEVIEGADEDDLVAKAQAHLSEAHPGRTYTREQILFMAS